MISRTLPKITPGIITGVNITLSTTMAWGTCTKFDLGLQWSLLLVPAYFAVWKLFYAGCNRISERIVNAFDKVHSDLITRKQQEAVEEALKNVEPKVIVKDSDYKDAVRFHDHYVAETSIVREQLVREDAEKLDKILSYTKETFMRLNFSQTEVAQILDCVRYFVCHKDVLNVVAMKISKKLEVTQASLKNLHGTSRSNIPLMATPQHHLSKLLSANGLPIRNSHQLKRRFATLVAPMLSRLMRRF